MTVKNKAYLALAFVSIAWGTTYFGIRVVVQHIPPYLFAGARQTLAGLLMFGIALLQKEKFQWSWKSIQQHALVGLLLIAGGNGFVCWGEQHIESNIAAIICSMMPLFAVLINIVLVPQEKINKKIITTPEAPKYQDVFGKTIIELAKANPAIMGITPAMPSGCSLKFMMEEMPDRAIDVGIAEQHAVTLSAGLATQGMRVFCNIYSSFMQRAYDMVIHGVAIQKLPVVFCLDRAGLVGDDGPTHHGTFDLAFLNAIPNLIILSPMDEHELRNMMYWALDYTKGPVVIRYPRGNGSFIDYQNEIQPFQLGTSRTLTSGNKLAIISIGEIGVEVQQAIELNNLQTEITHVDARCMKPLDSNTFKTLFDSFDKIITIEESCLLGGFGQQLKAMAQDHSYKGDIISLGLPDGFVEHGEIEELRAQYGLDAHSIGLLIRDYGKSARQ